MQDANILRDLVILVAVAIPVVVLANRLRIPPVVGFLITGMAIGPHGLGLISQPESVAGLAEVGVVLLLFAIGLELSLSRIIRLGRSVVLGGGLQVMGTIAVVAAIAVAFGALTRPAILYGSLVALSSTAIVLKVYTDRGELDTPHGRVAVAILLFQDLCVVPLMLLVPILAGAEVGVGAILKAVGLSLAVVGVLILGGRTAIPWILERIVVGRNREVFTLSVVFFGLGAAYITSIFGLSLALGAFVAGLVIAESEYGIQALSDILPFRDTFSGIFFTSVGMLFDVGFGFSHPGILLGATLGVFLVKAVLAAAATGALQRSLHVSIVTGLGLAQVGEFSFVLAGAAVAGNLLQPDAYQVFLGASLATMIATPFLISSADPIATWFCRLANRPALEIPPHEAKDIAALKDHVIIVGYGLNGQNLARVLREAGIPYVILEQSGQVLRRARLLREPIYFGDGTRHEVLERVGVARARVVVFAIAAPNEERRGVAAARQLNPAVQIIVRTRYVASIDELQRLGADEVVPEEFETSIEIFARVLRLYGVPTNTIEREINAIRGEHYEVLRGRAAPDLKLDTLKHLALQGAIDTLEVEPGAKAVGETLTSLNLRQLTGATIVAAVRDGTPLFTPDPEFRFRAGDSVVLVGSREALERAGKVFRTSPRRSSRISRAARLADMTDPAATG